MNIEVLYQYIMRDANVSIGNKKFSDRMKRELLEQLISLYSIRYQLSEAHQNKLMSNIDWFVGGTTAGQYYHHGDTDYRT